MRTDLGAHRVDQLLANLTSLHAEMMGNERSARDRIAKLHPAWQTSAQNLLDYLTLRRHDLRPLQDELAELGLSSLGRAEAHVRKTIEAVLSLLHLSSSGASKPPESRPLSRDEGRRLLETHADELL